MVNGKVGLLVDRCQLKLVWCHLIVTCLTRDAQFECLYLEVAHECCHALWDAAEVVVVHLLVLGRVVSHECPACEQQVGTCSVESLVNEEVLLLPSEVAGNLLNLRVEIVAHLGSSHIDSLQRTEQRCLVVECLTCV